MHDSFYEGCFTHGTGIFAVRFCCLNLFIDIVSCTISCSLVVLPWVLRRTTILTLLPQIFGCPISFTGVNT